MNGQFVLVAGIGHCGTRWLAQLLDQQKQGVIFYHQYKYTLGDRGWDDWLILEHDQPAAMAEYLDAYRENMQGQMKKYRIVGDAISWMPLSIPQIARVIKVDRIIYVVRNGIPQLNSIWHRSQFGRRGPEDWMFTHYMKWYWDLMGRPYQKKWDDWMQWEKTCLWWAASVAMPKWLRVTLPDVPIKVYRLEDLVGDINVLTGLAQSFKLNLAREHLVKWQRKDVNRKIQESHDPAVVWRAWPEAWRASFAAICGAGMARLGYTIPKTGE